MIIGISGWMGSGKGVVADYLVREYGFHKLAYADRLKDTVATLFSWPRSMLEGDSVDSREFRETPDSFWSEEFGYPFTPRAALQLVGTEGIRKVVNFDFWVKAVKLELIENPERDFVIPDVRFPNEFNLIRELGGEVWCVKRWEDPAWAHSAYLLNNNLCTEDDQEQHLKALEGIHESEWAWVGLPFDRVISNDTVVSDLEDTIEDVIKDLVKSDLSATRSF